MAWNLRFSPERIGAKAGAVENGDAEDQQDAGSRQEGANAACRWPERVNVKRVGPEAAGILGAFFS
jgi:hypothetical protein